MTTDTSPLLTDGELQEIEERFEGARQAALKIGQARFLTLRAEILWEEGGNWPALRIYSGEANPEQDPIIDSAINNGRDLGRLLKHVRLLERLLADRIADDGAHRELVAMGRRQMREEAAKAVRAKRGRDLLGTGVTAILAIPDTPPERGEAR